MSILNYIPAGMEAREWQIPVLLDIESQYLNKDLFILPASVAFGKSFIAVVVARWMESLGKTTAIITPRVALQNQYRDNFKDIPSLKGGVRYECASEGSDCSDTIETRGYPCKSCPYKKAQTEVIDSPIAVYNLASYLYNDGSYRKDVLIIDEAHLLLDFLSEQFTLKLWKHKDNYPDNLKTPANLVNYLVGQLANLVKSLEKKSNKDTAALARHYNLMIGGLKSSPSSFVIDEGEESYYGKPKTRLLIRPESMEGLAPILWDSSTHKIILMSATINRLDIKRLGFLKNGGSRVHELVSASPILPSRRPLDLSWGVNMSYKYQDKNMVLMANKVKELAEKHPESGICHLTYSIAKKIKPHLTGDRYIWHTSDSSSPALEEFLEGTGKILMACGMGEGLDLAGPKFTWQAILKVPFPNKSDKLIAMWYAKEKEWITWLTTQAILQRCGRICRDPEDYGITYILDNCIGNIPKKRSGLLPQAKAYNFLTEDFMESIIWG